MCGIFLDSRINPVSPALAGEFFTARPLSPALLSDQDYYALASMTSVRIWFKTKQRSERADATLMEKVTYTCQVERLWGFTYRPGLSTVSTPLQILHVELLDQLSLWCWKIYYREENSTSFSKVSTYT